MTIRIGILAGILLGCALGGPQPAAAQRGGRMQPNDFGNRNRSGSQPAAAQGNARTQQNELDNRGDSQPAAAQGNARMQQNELGNRGDFQPAAAPWGGRMQQNKFTNLYGVIVERNIFTRDRGRRVQTTPIRTITRSAPPPVAPEKNYVLRGVSQWGTEYIAFVENTSYGETQMFRVGNAILDNKITRITLDGIVVAKGTETTSVQIGSDLAGHEAGSALTLQELISRVERTESIPPDAAVTESAETAPEAAAPTETTPPTGVDRDDMLKLLLERRKKELGQ